jgi:Zinc finger, C2H2 type
MPKRGRRGKKKKEKIYCYYCERVFKDETTLVEHQRAKHFKCPKCPRRLLGLSSLLNHARKVHELDIDQVPDAVEHRSSVHVQVLGMSGIPDERAEKEAAQRQKIEKELERSAKRQRVNLPLDRGSNIARVASIEDRQRSANVHPQRMAHMNGSSGSNNQGTWNPWSADQISVDVAALPAASLTAVRPTSDVPAPAVALDPWQGGVGTMIADDRAVPPGFAPLSLATARPTGAAAQHDISPWALQQQQQQGFHEAPTPQQRVSQISAWTSTSQTSSSLSSSSSSSPSATNQRGMRLVFNPKEDISMEELRAQLPKHRASSFLSNFQPL